MEWFYKQYVLILIFLFFLSISNHIVMPSVELWINVFLKTHYRPSAYSSYMSNLS